MDSLLLTGLKGRELLNQLLSKGIPKRNAWDILYDWSIPKIFKEIIRIRKDLELRENYSEMRRWPEKIFNVILKAQLKELKQINPMNRGRIESVFEIKFLSACFKEIHEKMTPHTEYSHVIFYREKNKFPDWFDLEGIQNSTKAFFLSNNHRYSRHELSKEYLENIIQESWMIFLKNCKKKEFVLTAKVTTYLIGISKIKLLINGVEESENGTSTNKSIPKIDLDLSEYFIFSEFVKLCSLCFEKYSISKENFCLRSLLMHYNKVSFEEIGKLMNWSEESTKKRINECLETFIREIKNEKN